MEQLEFDCRLESERELEENVNIALEFACKQVKETSKSKVSNRHDGYGIASEFYAGMKLDQKKVDESMKDFLRILPTEDDAKAVEAASSLKNAATGLVLQATKLAAQADRIMHDLYEEVSSYTTPVEDYLEGQFEDAEADPEAEAEEEQEQSRDIRYRRNRRNERGSSRRTGYRDLRSEYHSRRRPGYGRSIYRKCNRHRRKYIRPE